MSDRKLCDWLDAYMEYTENSEPPKLFRLWTGISVLAAALQRKCYVQWGMLTFYPNLYVILVGPSGTRKGTAMYPGQALLRDLGVPMAADATTLQALIRRLKESTNTQINPDSGMAIFHSSMTIFSKEFTVFLGYKNDELIASLCDWYDCDERWKYDTKTSGTDEIMGVWVNLIGATTPDLINSCLPPDAIGGGLTSRIIFVVETRKAKTVPMPFLTPEQEMLKQKLSVDLEKISMLVGKIKYTENFLKAWIDWYIQTDSNPPATLANNSRFSGYVQRRANHAMKLSIIMSISRSNEMVLRTVDKDRAIKVLEATERNMPNVFAGVGRSSVADILPRIITFIRAKGATQYHTLLQHFYQDTDSFTLTNIIRTLQAMKYVEVKWKLDSPNEITWIGQAMTNNSSKEGDNDLQTKSED